MVDTVNRLARNHAVPRLQKQSSPLTDKEMFSPLRDEGILRSHWEQSGVANVQTKRGCNYNCSYCSYPTIEGRGVRPRAIHDVLNEIGRLHTDFGVDHIFFTDSVFNDSHGHFLDLAEAMAIRNMPVSWSAFFQPTPLSAEELRLLKRSGLHAMEVGIDASTDETLAGLRKPFRFEDAVQFNTACVAEKIPCAHYVIFGGPGETEVTLRHGLANLNRLPNSVIFPFSGIRLHAGTDLHATAVREGIVSENETLLKPKYYFSPHVDVTAMNEAIAKACAGHRARIFPPSEGLERMNILRRFGHRGLLWDTLVNFQEAAA